MSECPESKSPRFGSTEGLFEEWVTHADLARARELGRMVSPEAISARTGLPLAEVLAILEEQRVRLVPAVVICGRTGKVSRHPSFQAAYLHICTVCLVEWTWHTLAAYEAWRAQREAAQP